eukprot:3111332-Ditylum_brightwellii.AAC.1
MAPTTQVVCSTCKTAAGNIAPSASLVHWEHGVGGKGGEGDVGGTMVQQKGESWGFTGNPNFCPLKPMQWLQRAESFPYTQKGEG